MPRHEIHGRRDSDEGDAAPGLCAIAPRYEATIGQQADGEHRNIRRECLGSIVWIACEPEQRRRANYPGGDKEDHRIPRSAYPPENERKGQIERHLDADRPPGSNNTLVRAGEKVKDERRVNDQEFYKMAWRPPPQEPVGHHHRPKQRAYPKYSLNQIWPDPTISAD